MHVYLDDTDITDVILADINLQEIVLRLLYTQGLYGHTARNLTPWEVRISTTTYAKATVMFTIETVDMLALEQAVERVTAQHTG